jgi:putative membrane protein
MALRRSHSSKKRILKKKNWNSCELCLVTVAKLLGGNMRSFVLATLATLLLTGCGAANTPDFVQKAAMSDMYEVQAGKLAAEKGQSDAVKQFAQQMVDAHTKTTEELTGIVKSKNIKVDLPSALDSTHQKSIDDLNSASAQDFDKTYANQQVDAHQEAVHLFKKYAAKGDDADVKQWVEKTLPTIEHHLDEAKKLPVGPPSA